MNTMDKAGITFVNTVIGRGVLNGVVNLQLGAYLFTAEGEKVEADPVVVARLRMDEPAARQMHEALGEVLGLIDAAKVTPAGEPAAAKTETVN